MKIKLDAMYLTLLAALGLELGCAARPVGSDAGTADGTDSSGSGSSSGSAEAGDGDGAPPEPHMCENPQDVLQAGTELPSGFVMCDDGFIHRADQTDAVDPVGPDDPACAMALSCQTGADCIDQPYGRCIEPLAGCFCSYGCASDADCNDGFVCAPGGVAGIHSTCIPADCTTDADCGDGLCGLSVYEGCCGPSYELACASPSEACHVNADCGEGPCNPDVPDGALVMYQCTVQSQFGVDVGQWTCKPPGWCGCDCGRPFFVDGEARVAAILTRSDWCGRDLGVLEPVDADTRQRLVEHWTRVAQFEHASVASFARFAMQLLQLGAPPRLLRDTAAALADEIEHAQLCFALASAYAGRAIGPAGLDVSAAASGAARGVGLREVVEGLIVEACVGETLAAIEAREAALWAEDRQVAALLEQIADDEWRHAQLGWASLAWLLEQGDASLRAFALATFTDTLAAVSGAALDGDGSSDDQSGLRCHGVLDTELRAQLRRAGIRDLIGPCVETLREGDRCATARYIRSSVGDQA